MLEYVSVCKIQVSISASEGVSTRSTDRLVWTTGGQGCKQTSIYELAQTHCFNHQKCSRLQYWQVNGSLSDKAAC